MRSKKPNILIIMIDSMRADHVSCYGYERITTPNIDRLAAEGCVFENAFTAAPFSPASYASLFSNMYTSEHGVNGDTVRVWPDGFERLAQKMKAKGYATFGISSNGFVGKATNSTQGFDVFIETYRRAWLPRKYGGLVRRIRKVAGDRVANRLELHHVRWPEMRRSAVTMKRAASLMEKLPSPFFGFIILMDPHSPYDGLRREFCTRDAALKHFLRNINDGRMWVKLMAERGSLTGDELRVALELYDGQILHADRCVGVLWDWMRRIGIADDTLVVVASDHGEAFGECGVWGHGFCLHDCLTRVPLIVRCPRYFEPGTRSVALTQLHDIHELCCSVAEDDGPRPDLHPHCLTQASGAGWKGREFAFSEFPRQSGTLAYMRGLNPGFEPGIWDHDSWSVRSKHWRYTEYGDGTCELYDVGSDRLSTCVDPELHEGVAARLRHELKRFRDAGCAEAPAEEFGALSDPDVQDRLRALGYMD